MAITSWVDELGYANFVQPIEANRPVIEFVNGIPVVRTNGGATAGTATFLTIDEPGRAIYRHAAAGAIMILCRLMSAPGPTASPAFITFSPAGAGGANRLGLRIENIASNRWQLASRRLDTHTLAQTLFLTHPNAPAVGEWVTAYIDANWAEGTARIRLNGVEQVGTFESVDAGSGPTSDTDSIAGNIGAYAIGHSGPNYQVAKTALFGQGLDSASLEHWESQFDALRVQLEA